jgi:acetyl esterase/lipase
MKRRNGPSRNLVSPPAKEGRGARVSWVVLTFAVFLALASGFVSGQTDASSSSGLPVDKYLSITAIPLYEGPAPGDTSTDPATAPFLTVFPPEGTPNGTAVIIAPGGGYEGLASNHEGRQEADWFARLGVVAFVLKYRLGPGHLFPQPLQDAQRAIRLVRVHAAEFGISPERIGFMGFSAGGHLAAETGTEFDAGNPAAKNAIDRVSSRPDFLILGYPWLYAMQLRANGGSEYCSGLKINDAALCKHFAEAYTPELHVSAQTPPSFIFHTTADTAVPVQSSLSFYAALVHASVPVEMHIFGEGLHGVGLGGSNPHLNAWPMLLEGWMRTRGLLTPDRKTVTK